MVVLDSAPEPKPIEIITDEDGKKKAVQKKKTGTSRKKKKENIDSDQLALLISSLFGVIASRPDMGHWQVSIVEAKTIAEPLSNILASSDTFKDFGKYADHIALIIAATVIIIPRMMITADLSKKKKEVKKAKKEAIENNDRKRVKDKQDTGNSKRSNEKLAIYGNDDVEPVFDAGLAVITGM